MPRFAVEWPAHHLLAREPTADELAAVAPALADAYNHPHNRAMLGNTEPMSGADVIAHYGQLHAHGDRPFLFYSVQRGAPTLIGDGDFRHVDVERRRAEFALLIAQTSAHGKGWGTKFALMLHALAFAPPGRGLDLDELFVTIVPANAASQRLFAKLGYRVDARPEARRYIDDESDLSMSIDRAHFAAQHGPLVDIHPSALE